MPPKGSRGRAGRGRGRGRGAAKVAETTPAEPSATAPTNEDSSQSTLADTAAEPSATASEPAPATTTPQNDPHGDSRTPSPNSSPATVPTETPAPTPVRVPPSTASNAAPAASTSPRGRGGVGLLGEREKVAGPSRFKPKAVRRDGAERERLAREEDGRNAALQREAQEEEARNARGLMRGRGRGGRGRGDVMGRKIINTMGGGTFSIAPEEMARRTDPNAPMGGGGGGGSGGGGSGGGGSGGGRSRTKGEGDGGWESYTSWGGGGGDRNASKSQADFIPEYPDDPDPLTKRIDIEQINLVSDEDEDPIVTSTRSANKGKGKAPSNYGGLRPVRLQREEHKIRKTVVNAQPDTEPKIKKERSDEMEIDEHRSSKIHQATRIKTESGLAPKEFPETSPRPSSPRPKEEPASPTTGKKPRKPLIKKAPEPVLQTEEDIAEHRRYLNDIDILAEELAGTQQAADANGGVAMDGGAGQLVDRSGRLYLFQFPPVLPKLYNPMTSSKPEPSRKGNPTQSQDGVGIMGSSGKAAPSGTEVKVKTEEEVIIKQEEVEVEMEKPLVEEEGWIGKLIVRESGRVELTWGGTSMVVKKGTSAGFLSTGVMLDGHDRDPLGTREGKTKEGKAFGMGKIMGKMVVPRSVLIGAGLAGLSAALSTKVATPEHEVTILESVKELAEVGAGLQLTPNATRLFKPWGIYDSLLPTATFPTTLNVRRYDGTKTLSSTPNFQDQVDERYSAPFWGMHRVDLQRAMASRCQALGVKILLNSKVSAVDFKNAEVILDNDDVIMGDVVLCTDGLWSSTRSQFLGKPSPAILTGDLAYRIVINTADLIGPDAPELRKFITDSHVNFWIGPKTHVGANSSLEDGAVLGYLLGKVNQKDKESQLRKAAEMYQRLRKERGEAIQKETFRQREDFHMEDGKGQRVRDEAFAKQWGKEIEGDFPSRWQCPRVQRWLYGYDSYAVVEEAFQEKAF
ncbi:putative 3-hydroxybenzoate 6-hydroxylase 1 [Amylocarpus encephaloides]|uniref:3-hydroxybenzoate 6-hydroxylase 1 n=1 Tax=Amylocarpus encephaloides TaxID=45428 RepID=A0A9P8C8Y1_9HELO|nr:putative 3-hydroxybenzoate 6-hydroxylase 1 [Amylocarpus encephaloides]